MKVVVTGASGRIGFGLVEKFVNLGFDCYHTFLKNQIQIKGSRAHKMDLGERDDVLNVIRDVKPEIVVHSAALTNVDLCETDNELANRVNVQGTQNIVDACKDAGSRIVYVSTSFVFDGKLDLFKEDDEPGPVNYYGKSKLAGENIVKKSGLEFLILRTDQPYGWKKDWQQGNQVVNTLRKFDKKDVFSEPKDWYNNPTFLPNFVDAAVALVEDFKGIYHLVGSDFLNRYEWSLKIADVFGKDKSLVKAVDSSQFNLPAKRPNANVSNEKVQKETGVEFFGVEEGLKKMKSRL